jgi:hypothetical protein
MTEYEDLLWWINTERNYQIEKWGSDDGGYGAIDDKHIKEGFGEDSWLWQQTTNYVGRVRMFGLDHRLGRQAYMKLIATLVGLGEAMWRVYGEPPIAGFPSGEVNPSNTTTTA